MWLPKKIRVALKRKNRDLYHWSTLLNFFESQQDKLSGRQKIKIYKKCELLRQYWNTTRIKEVRLVRPSGKVQTTNKPILPLNIEKEDVRPNNIYTDKDIQKFLQASNRQPTFGTLSETLTRFLPACW